MRCEVRSGRREGVWAGGGASGAQGGATGGWAQGMGGTVKDERSPSLSMTQQARRAGNTKGECQPLTLVATRESRSVRMATRGRSLTVACYWRSSLHAGVGASPP